MNLNFKVPTWDFIMTDPSSPKISSPKSSSPKTNSPKLIHNLKSQSHHPVYNNTINLSSGSSTSTKFINESGKVSVRKTPSKPSSVIPISSSPSSSPNSLKVPFYQAPQSPQISQLPQISQSPSIVSQPLILDSNAPNTGYKLELEQRLHKRQLQKMLEKQLLEKEKQFEKEKQNQLLLQQQQIQKQQQQIQLQQQQIQQLQQQQIQQQQNHYINNNNNNNISLISSPYSQNNKINNNNIETNAPISLPPLPNKLVKNNFPSCDVLLKSSSPSPISSSPLSMSPSFHNVPSSVESHFSINHDSFLQLPPIRDEIF